MSDYKIWFPSPHILKLVYSQSTNRNSDLNHILRVWLFSMMIGREMDGVESNLLSATVLFRNIGNGNKSADEWIDKNFHLLFPEFSEEDCRRIVDLCKKLASKESHDEDTYISIIHDADTLSRSNGKFDPSTLSLKQSRSIFEKAEEIRKMWNMDSRNGKTPFQILTAILDNEEIALPKQLKEFNNGNDRLKYRELLGDPVKLISDSEKLGKSTAKATEEVQIDIKLIKEAEQILQKINDIAHPNDILIISIKYSILERLRKHYDRASLDKRYPKRIQEDIKKIHQKVTKSQEDLRKIESFSMDGVYLLFGVKDKYTTTFTESLLDFCSYSENPSVLKIVSVFSSDHHTSTLYEYFTEMYRKDWEIVDPFNANASPSFSIQLIRILTNGTFEKWAQIEPEVRERNLLGASDMCIKSINQYDLSLEQINDLFELIGNILEKMIGSIPTEKFGQIKNLFEKAFPASTTLAGIEAEKAYRNINIFCQFRGQSKETERYFKLFEKVVNLLGRIGLDLDQIIENYLLPASLNSEFKYDIDRGLLEEIERSSVSEKVRETLQIKEELDEGNIHEIILHHTRDRSESNLSSFLDSSKFKSLVASKNKGYRITITIQQIDHLKYILQSNIPFLSIFNIVNSDSNHSYPFVEREILKFERDKIWQLRDGIQREMLVRRPDIKTDHPVYGTLQHILDLTEKVELSKRKGGEIHLLLNEKVQERSIFTRYDSSWENRRKPMSFEDAKYTYEKIRSELVQSESNSSIPYPISYLTTFVEATILGGLRANDIEMILISEKIAKKHHRTIEYITEQIEGVEVKSV